MTGLNKIIERISQDSVAKCDEILFDAQNEASKIKDAATVEGNKIKEKAIDDANSHAETMINMANSGAQLATRKQLLATKIDIIDSALNSALNKLRSLPDKEYFASIYALVKEYAQDSEGTMYLSKKDLDRKPRDFEKKVNEQLSKEAKIKVSSEPRDIDAGFILAYGDIEINCTFIALIEDARDELKDEIYNVFFA